MKPILVIKVGTSTLLDKEEVPSQVFDSIATSIRALRDEYNIILVTSGAIGFGVTQLRLDDRPTEVSRLQALSMIGQVGLLRRWREALDGLTVGQVLVTRRDLELHKTTELFCESVQAVWNYGAIPIVNENDAVSTDEITFGDNDRLAAEVAVALDAHHLVLLTDQDGIQADFGTPQQARVPTATPREARHHIMDVSSVYGKGGAASKIEAAQVAVAGGVEVSIAHAAIPGAIEEALSGKSGTKLVK